MKREKRKARCEQQVINDERAQVCHVKLQPEAEDRKEQAKYVLRHVLVERETREGEMITVQPVLYVGPFFNVVRESDSPCTS